MARTGNHLGMDLHVDPIDQDNVAFFGYCASGEFRLQSCGACSTLRYPPAPRCAVCGSAACEWVPASTSGFIHTFTVVHQATHAHMKPYTPYAVVVVELDAQPGHPLRVPANLVDAQGAPLRATPPRSWGIGSRVRMTYASAGLELGLPVWQLDTMV